MELTIGRIVKSHGIKGEVVVEIRTDDPDQRFAVGTIVHGYLPNEPNNLREFTIASQRGHAGRFLVQFAHITDRLAAEALRGTVLVIDSQHLPPTEADEFYDFQLHGLRVVGPEDSHIGIVKDVVHSAGGQLLCVHTVGQDTIREILIPFVQDIVTSVSLEHGLIEINPPEGLLDL